MTAARAAAATPTAEFTSPKGRLQRFFPKSGAGSRPEGLAGQELSELEQIFDSHIGHYQPYWTRKPAFDCRNTLAAVPQLPCPRIDKACLHRLLDFAIADQWGKR